MTTAPTPKRVALLVYDSFAEFEVAVLLTALGRHTLTTVGPTGDPVVSTGGLRVLPDLALADLDPEYVDALVVPGGEASPLLGLAALQDLVRTLDARGALLAAICGGPAVLGDAGVLDDRRFTASLNTGDAAWPGIAGRGQRLDELVVHDGHVVTAQGSAYLAFAEEVLRHLDDRPTVVPLSFFRVPELYV